MQPADIRGDGGISQVRVEKRDAWNGDELSLQILSADEPAPLAPNQMAFTKDIDCFSAVGEHH